MCIWIAQVPPNTARPRGLIQHGPTRSVCRRDLIQHRCACESGCDIRRVGETSFSTSTSAMFGVFGYLQPRRASGGRPRCKSGVNPV